MMITIKPSITEEEYHNLKPGDVLKLNDINEYRIFRYFQKTTDNIAKYTFVSYNPIADKFFLTCITDVKEIIKKSNDICKDCIVAPSCTKYIHSLYCYFNKYVKKDNEDNYYLVFLGLAESTY